MAEPALTVDGVWWRYRRAPWLLRDVSVTVRPGGLLRVRGGNGSGKSTLLRLVAGCVTPHRGRVHRSGPAGYLPQQARGLPPIAAGRLHGLLSGGSSRPLLLDVVLGLDTRLLVLDEPTSGLDDDGVDRLTDVLAKRLAGGAAVVVAEHRPLPLAGGEVLDLGGVAEPDLVLITLGGAGVFRGESSRDGLVTLAVPAAERDVLLLEALRAGWSILRVGPRR